MDVYYGIEVMWSSLSKAVELLECRTTKSIALPTIMLGVVM